MQHLNLIKLTFSYKNMQAQKNVLVDKTLSTRNAICTRTSCPSERIHHGAGSQPKNKDISSPG